MCVKPYLSYLGPVLMNILNFLCKVKAKLSICLKLIRHYAMEVFGGVDV
jgi:hypothetical protein